MNCSFERKREVVCLTFLLIPKTMGGCFFAFGLVWRAKRHRQAKTRTAVWWWEESIMVSYWLWWSGSSVKMAQSLTDRGFQSPNRNSSFVAREMMGISYGIILTMMFRNFREKWLHSRHIRQISRARIRTVFLWPATWWKSVILMVRNFPEQWLSRQERQFPRLNQSHFTELCACLESWIILSTIQKGHTCYSTKVYQK